MWIASKYGFFSIVVKEDGFHIRARVQQDLVQLLSETGIKGLVQEWPNADYRYRVILGGHEIPGVFQKLAGSIDYGNFKSMIAATPSQYDKYKAYGQIWSIMYQLQEGIRKY